MRSSKDDVPRFLRDGGDTARLIATRDWTDTLGPIESWPESLKSTVGLIVHSPIAMVVLWGPDGVMIYNEAYSVFAGGRHPGILGAKVLEAWPEAADLNAEVMRVGLAGGTLSYKDRHLTLYRPGRPLDVWTDLDYSPVFDESGRPAGVIAIVVETTERVLAERRQQAFSTRLRQQFEQAPGFVIIMTGPEHTVEFVNQTHRRVFGSDDWVGKPIREAFPSIEGQGFFEALDRVYATGETVEFHSQEVRYQRRPGGPMERRYLTFVYAPIQDETGTVTSVFCDGYDVTATQVRVAHTEAMALLSEQLRNLDDPKETAAAAARVLGEALGAARVGYGAIDPDSDTLRVDRDWTAPGVESLAGITDLRAYGAFVESLKRNELVTIADVRKDPRTRARAEALEARGVRAFLNVPVIEQGRLVAVLFAVDPEVRHWSDEELELSREVAERTRTAVERARGQEALRASAAELAHLNATLEQRVEERTRQLLVAEEALRQAQKMEAVGQLTGGIAHDFNNLLTGISGSLELLEKRIGEGRMQSVDRYINAAQQASKRAAALTQRLLAFSRRQTLDPRAIDANRLVAGMEELIRRSVGPDVEIEVVGAGGLWTTRVDPSQLENALLNLCINARDAMAPAGGRITIETANRWLEEHAAKERDLPPGQYISLSVSDTGVGMTPEVITRAFDPFYTTKPLGEGTGLGLSMVYGFARQSGGQVRIYSEVGKGTTVCLYLPRFVGEAEAAETAGQARMEAGDGEIVLVVDDEPTIRQLIVEVLAEAGYTAMEAGDGPSALKVLQSDARIDLLITDVGLPGGMNGRQVADAARVTRPGLKVLFITGFAENAVVGNGHLESGMAVVTKPFVLSTLGARIRDLIDG